METAWNMSKECTFCSIVSGRAPAEICDADAHCVSFLDTSPLTQGHALVVSRKHARDLFELDPQDLGHAAVAARRLALRMRDQLDCDGVNLINACGAAAWQTVWHFHIHVIPRYRGDPLKPPAGQRSAADHQELK